MNSFLQKFVVTLSVRINLNVSSMLTSNSRYLKRLSERFLDISSISAFIHPEEVFAIASNFSI